MVSVFPKTQLSLGLCASDCSNTFCRLERLALLLAPAFQNDGDDDGAQTGAFRQDADPYEVPADSRLTSPARITLPCRTGVPLIFSIDGIHDIRNATGRSPSRATVE